MFLNQLTIKCQSAEKRSNFSQKKVRPLTVFIEQIFRAAEKAPPGPLPPPCCAVQGMGLYWLLRATRRGFGYDFEAMRIRRIRINSSS
jgi:hypothetical protein